MSALARRWKQCYLGGSWVGNRGTKARRSTRPQANLPTPPDEQQSSDSPPTAEAMATTLPQGEFHSVPCVCFRSILRSILIAPRAVCGCSTSSLLSREACTVWQHVCVQLCVGTVVGIPAYVLCCCCTAVFEPVREWYRSYRCLCDTSATVQTRNLNTHSAVGGARTFCSNEHVVTYCGWCYSYLLLQRARGDHTDVLALSSPGQALRVFTVAVRCVYLRRTSVLSLVPIVALLFYVRMVLVPA